MAKLKTQSQFLQEALEIYGDKYDYSKINYINSSHKIKIICKKHGEFYSTPSNHLLKKGCTKCSLENTLLRKQAKFSKINFDKLKILQPNLDFSKSIYLGTKEKILVICKIHNTEHLVLPHNLFKAGGCKLCGEEIRKIKKYTYENRILKRIEESKIIHNNKYNYSKIDYTYHCRKLQTIICPIHGEFKQRLDSHKSGAGCLKCVKEENGAWGFKHSVWKKIQKERKAKVYFVKFFNNKEEFYKIGITYQNLKNRFTNIPYKRKIIKVKEYDDPQKALDLELKFKRFFKKYKYKPLKNFGGETECFKNISI